MKTAREILDNHIEGIGADFDVMQCVITKCDDVEKVSYNIDSYNVEFTRAGDACAMVFDGVASYSITLDEFHQLKGFSL